MDVSCSGCGREPSHPHVQHRFVYAAYYRALRWGGMGQRSYVAALCEPCYEADRRTRTSAARNRFFRQVRHWSGLPGNQGQIVRLLEHPEGVTGDEWEADNCFYNGVAVAYHSLAVETESPPLRRAASSRHSDTAAE